MIDSRVFDWQQGDWLTAEWLASLLNPNLSYHQQTVYGQPASSHQVSGPHAIWPRPVTPPGWLSRLFVTWTWRWHDLRILVHDKWPTTWEVPFKVIQTGSTPTDIYVGEWHGRFFTIKVTFFCCFSATKSLNEISLTYQEFQGQAVLKPLDLAPMSSLSKLSLKTTRFVAN